MTISVMIKVGKECWESTGGGVGSRTLRRITEEGTYVGHLLNEWIVWMNSMKKNDVSIGVNAVPWEDDLGFGK